MRTVHPPSRNMDRIADRTSECRAALEPALMQLIDRAQSAGWQRGELLHAVVMLARSEIETATIFAVCQDTGSRMPAP